MHRNGGDLIAALPEQTSLLGEAGVRFDVAKLTPILRFEKRWGEGTAGDETLLGAGLSWFAYGHTSNLKGVSISTSSPETRPIRSRQFNLRWQLAFYAEGCCLISRPAALARCCSSY